MSQQAGYLQLVHVSFALAAGCDINTTNLLWLCAAAKTAKWDMKPSVGVDGTLAYHNLLNLLGLGYKQYFVV